MTATGDILLECGNKRVERRIKAVREILTNQTVRVLNLVTILKSFLKFLGCAVLILLDISNIIRHIILMKLQEA